MYINDYAYEGLRRVTYDCGQDGTAYFVAVCPKCCRFVKADGHIHTGPSGLADKANATCSRCGRIQMPFEGFF